MNDQTKPLILVDSDEDDSLESWLPSARAPSIQNCPKDIQIVPLPEGKSHHLFFSHSSVDQESVYNWATSLERDYGILCYLPERDFRPGEPVLKNIVHGMSVCLKIVLVLTPDYVDSGWCDYERFLAFTMSMQERRYSIIPVQLHPCAIPEELMQLNYIDVSKTKNMEGKLIEVLKDKCELKNILPTTFQTQKLDEPNGIRLNTSSEKVLQSKLKGSAWHFTKFTSYNQERIKNSNMRITEQQLGHLRKLLNTSFALKYHGIFHSGLPLLVFCANGFAITCFIMTALVALSQWIFRFSNDSIGLYVAITLSVLQVLYFVIFFAAWKVIKGKSMSNIKTKVRNLSVEWNSVTKALIFTSSDPHPVLVFMMYDLKPCKEHIKTRLMQLYDAANTTESERLLHAEETATHHINSYLMENNDSLYQWNRLEESISCRHYTLMRKKCVCELVEQKLWGNVQ